MKKRDLQYQIWNLAQVVIGLRRDKALLLARVMGLQVQLGEAERSLMVLEANKGAYEKAAKMLRETVAEHESTCHGA